WSEAVFFPQVSVRKSHVPPCPANLVGCLVGCFRRRPVRPARGHSMTFVQFVVANRLRLDPELTKLVERARRQAAVSGELTPVRSLVTDPLPPGGQRVCGAGMERGEFAAPVAGIGAEDPGLADQRALLAAACEELGMEPGIAPF